MLTVKGILGWVIFAALVVSGLWCTASSFAEPDAGNPAAMLATIPVVADSSAGTEEESFPSKITLAIIAVGGITGSVVVGYYMAKADPKWTGPR